MHLHAYGNTVNVGEKGVKVILSNKQILSFPTEKIEVDVSDGGYHYSAYITITPDNLMLLKKNQILKWRLYIYDNEQGEYQAERFRNWINCIVNIK